MKKPSIALILSILLPGMGHIYLKKKSGIVMVLFYLAGVAALIFWADNMENVFDVILWLFILLLFAAYDSYRTGKRENKLLFSKSSDLQGEEIGPGEYYFRRPFSVHSTKPFPIFDSRGKVVCYLQRYYKNKKERLLELFTSMRFTNIKGTMAQGKCIVRIEDAGFKANLFRMKWNVFIEEDGEKETFLLTDKTFIRTNHEFTFPYKGMDYTFTKDMFDKVGRIKGTGGTLLVEFIPDDPVMHIGNTIRLNNSSIGLPLIACIYYIHLLYD